MQARGSKQPREGGAKWGEMMCSTRWEQNRAKYEQNRAKYEQDRARMLLTHLVRCNGNNVVARHYGINRGIVAGIVSGRRPASPAVLAKLDIGSANMLADLMPEQIDLIFKNRWIY